MTDRTNIIYAKQKCRSGIRTCEEPFYKKSAVVFLNKLRLGHMFFKFMFKMISLNNQFQNDKTYILIFLIIKIYHSLITCLFSHAVAFSMLRIVCPEGKYGYNCSMDCHCVKGNTMSCDVMTGTCKCNDGWAGTTCNTDIDECSNPDVYKCSVGTACQNTQGSFNCLSQVNYFLK